MEGLRGRTISGKRSLSLIIPAFNEATGIRQAIEEADSALAGLLAQYEIIVVDDGSSDETSMEVINAAKEFPRVRLLRHPENRGYGAALRTGLEAARFDWVAFTDADCQFELADLGSLMPLADSYPVVVGYRMDRKDSPRRRFFSWGYNLLARSLLGTGVRDCDCALKVFRRDAVQKLLPEDEGFFVNTEMLARARQMGYAIAEVGVRHRPRLRGTSKVSMLDIPRIIKVLLPFWWTQAMFPGGSKSGPETDERAPPLGTIFGGLAGALPQFIALVLVAGFLFYTRLGCPLQEPEEPRYAEIPRQMLATDNFIVPVLHGEPYYDKPPLLYWLVMVSYRVFGISDGSARLVSASATLLTVLVTYFWGRRVVGSLPAFVGALVLCLSARFVYLGRLLTMNSLLCLCVVTALAAAHIALIQRRAFWRWWLGSALACGLGLLTKGPVTLALVLVPLLALQMLDHRTARPGMVGWAAYFCLAIGLAAPWYGWIAANDPTFVGYFFWKQNLVRYVAPFDHAKPFWYYFSDVLIGMLPWSLLVPFFVRYLFRRASPGASQRPAALGLFVISAVWIFVFYSLAGSKRAGYILPVMPPLALALGCYVDSIVRSFQAGSESLGLLRQRARLLAARLTSMMLPACATLGIFCYLAGYVKIGPALVIAGLPAAGAWSARRLAQKRHWGAAATAFTAATFAVLLAACYLMLPGYARRYSLRGEVRPHAELARDPEVSIVCYPRRWDSVSFYLGRDDVKVYAVEQRRQLIADLKTNTRTLAFIKAERPLEELLRDLPSSLEFVPQGRQGGVAVGLIRPRWEVPEGYFADRPTSEPQDNGVVAR
jgi:dolichol-phosphate mannosyltransferase